jgi:hypothetical protein
MILASCICGYALGNRLNLFIWIKTNRTLRTIGASVWIDGIFLLLYIFLSEEVDSIEEKT